ncbi:hypothetical protein [Paraburkholderia humisilvae]|uniref:hypothetical protein n=1 Tax=Paraburkholderia humisilvae TaxID=627669 RepID=UPI0015832A55|nr:hypothetical protein [Paraburkholderia humisilvae]
MPICPHASSSTTVTSFKAIFRPFRFRRFLSGMPPDHAAARPDVIGRGASQMRRNHQKETQREAPDEAQQK